MCNGVHLGKTIGIKRRSAESGNGSERSDKRKRIVKRSIERISKYCGRIDSKNDKLREGQTSIIGKFIIQDVSYSFDKCNNC